jgi:hypothetical protein
MVTSRLSREGYACDDTARMTIGTGRLLKLGSICQISSWLKQITFRVVRIWWMHSGTDWRSKFSRSHKEYWTLPDGSTVQYCKGWQFYCKASIWVIRSDRNFVRERCLCTAWILGQDRYMPWTRVVLRSQIGGDGSKLLLTKRQTQKRQT